MACTYDNSKEEYEGVRMGNLVSHAKLTHREAVPPVMAVMVVHRVGVPGTADIVGAGASRLAAGLVDVEGVIVTAGLALAVGFHVAVTVVVLARATAAGVVHIVTGGIVALARTTGYSGTIVRDCKLVLGSDLGLEPTGEGRLLGVAAGGRVLVLGKGDLVDMGTEEVLVAGDASLVSRPGLEEGLQLVNRGVTDDCPLFVASTGDVVNTAEGEVLIFTVGPVEAGTLFGDLESLFGGNEGYEADTEELQHDG